jgi:hypothetical protein
VTRSSGRRRRLGVPFDTAGGARPAEQIQVNPTANGLV